MGWLPLDDVVASNLAPVLDECHRADEEGGDHRRWWRPQAWYRGREGIGLAQANQVGGDGPRGAVLGPQVPLEERMRGLSARWSMTRNGNQEKR
jgi:hypothetical protein